MNKVVARAAEAVADIVDGASVAFGGFSFQHGFPTTLLAALLDRGSRELTLVCNSLGRAGTVQARLVEEHRVRKLITSLSARGGEWRPAIAEQLIAAGALEVELVAQGTLVERMRAAGAGLAGFYTPTGVGTAIAAGKELRTFGGRAFLFESALHVDFALIRAMRADRTGNLEFRGGSQNLHPSFAKGARVAIAEVDEIVEVGEIPPERVGLSGIWVSRIVRAARELEAEQPPARATDLPRRYNGKPGLSREAMAARAARLIPEGGYVNLGLGIPTLVSNYLGEREVMLHAENGIMGYGRRVAGDEVDLDHYNAGGQYVSIRPGAAFFDSVASFEMAHSGKFAAVILGGYQVDEEGGLANWSRPEQIGGGIGGAMDLVSSGSPVWILMEHTDVRTGAPKLVKKCSYPLTGVGCVSTVITDIALLERRGGRWILEEVAPGFSVEEVRALTQLDLAVAEPVGTLEG